MPHAGSLQSAQVHKMSQLQASLHRAVQPDSNSIRSQQACNSGMQGPRRIPRGPDRGFGCCGRRRGCCGARTCYWLPCPGLQGQCSRTSSLVLVVTVLSAAASWKLCRSRVMRHTMLCSDGLKICSRMRPISSLLIICAGAHCGHADVRLVQRRQQCHRPGLRSRRCAVNMTLVSSYWAAVQG